MENRSVIWDVECSPSLMIRSIRLPRGRRGAKERTRASTPTEATERIATNWLSVLRKNAMPRIGSSSPTAPAAMI